MTEAPKDIADISKWLKIAEHMSALMYVVDLSSYYDFNDNGSQRNGILEAIADFSDVLSTK